MVIESIDTSFSSVVFIYNRENDKFLSVSRKNNGKIAAPGGKVELGETVRESAIRELSEEVNLSINDSDLSFILKCKDEHNHIVSTYFIEYSKDNHGEPESMEKGGVASWESADDLKNHNLCEFPDLNSIVLSIIKTKAHMGNYNLKEEFISTSF